MKKKIYENKKKRLLSIFNEETKWRNLFCYSVQALPTAPVEGQTFANAIFSTVLVVFIALRSSNSIFRLRKIYIFILDFVEKDFDL